jgi:oligoribonuclease (3'-5' exoribonuclease)
MKFDKPDSFSTYKKEKKYDETQEIWNGIEEFSFYKKQFINEI